MQMTTYQKVHAHVSMHLQNIYPGMTEANGYFMLSSEPLLFAQLAPTGLDSDELSNFFLTCLTGLAEGLPRSGFLFEVVSELNKLAGPSKLITVPKGDLVDVMLSSTVPADDLQERELKMMFAVTSTLARTIPPKLFQSLATNKLPS